MKPLSLFAECQNRRDRLVYYASFLTAVAIGTAGSFDSLSSDTPGWQIAMVVVFGLISCLGLFYRRRWPVGVGVFVVIVGFTGPLAGGAYLIALLNLAIRRPWRFAAALSAFTVLTAPLYLALYPSGDPILLYMFLLTIVSSGVVAWGMYIRARRELVESLRARTRQAEADRDQRLAQAREQERTRIAREMHDVLAHRISLVALNAGALEFRPDASPEEVQEAAAVVRANAHLALDELRT
ncbi:MAG: histidine kinase dimerization/phosphoacceptor domain-containing protein [Solirubrobacterales bacterium]|nr:histidine kinase dimerization/phosphoacceptor domain-containing protein [Solirubrobacterales bacterium]